MKLTPVILVVFLLMTLVAGSCFWAVSEGYKEALGTKIDPTRYAQVVAQRQQHGNVFYDFLPTAIPADAEAVSFVHTPGFLQGGDTIMLRARLPAERLHEMLRALENSGRQEVSDFTPAPPPRCYPRFGLTEADIKKGNIVERPVLPSDFRIFLHRTDLKDIEKNWNHNFLAFTAISTERREVVYHVDNW